MKLIDYTVHEFVKELDSASPAPGGGSASALASAMGMALSRMVGHLTIPKKKFKALDDSVQDTFIEVHEVLRDFERRTLELIDADTAAFNEIMKAFKMPKDSDEAKKRRKDAIETATYKATEVPLEIAEVAFKVLKKMHIILKHGNKNAISDIGVSVLLLHAGLEGAILNVKINLPGISDQAYVSEIKERITVLHEEGKAIKSDILSQVHGAIE